MYDFSFTIHNGYGVNVYVNGKLKKKCQPTSKLMPHHFSREKVRNVNIGDEIKFVLTEGYWKPKEVKTLSTIVIEDQLRALKGYDPFLQSDPSSITYYNVLEGR